MLRLVVLQSALCGIGGRGGRRGFLDVRLLIVRVVLAALPAAALLPAVRGWLCVPVGIPAPIPALRSLSVGWWLRLMRLVLFRMLYCLPVPVRGSRCR